MAVPNVDPIENLERMKAGEMYYAFTPDLMADRRRCKQALTRYNKAQDISRREELEMLNEYISSTYLSLSLSYLTPSPSLRRPPPQSYVYASG